MKGTESKSTNDALEVIQRRGTTSPILQTADVWSRNNVGQTNTNYQSHFKLLLTFVCQSRGERGQAGYFSGQSTLHKSVLSCCEIAWGEKFPGILRRWGVAGTEQASMKKSRFDSYYLFVNAHNCQTSGALAAGDITRIVTCGCPRTIIRHKD